LIRTTTLSVALEISESTNCAPHVRQRGQTNKVCEYGCAHAAILAIKQRYFQKGVGSIGYWDKLTIL
jgi:hypothetical protein